MTRFIVATAAAIVLAFPAGTRAQDSTTKSETKIKADDGTIVTMTGCLSRGARTNLFTLNGAITAAGDEAKLTSTTKTEVDDDDVEVRTRTETKVDKDDDRPVGTGGVTARYDVTANDQINLLPYVGHHVEIAALLLDPAEKGDDDAKVEVETRTRTKTDDRPDSESRERVSADLQRARNGRLVAVSVKSIAPRCDR